MTVGSLARRLLGDRLFVRVAGFYRALFVDLDAVADCLPRFAPGTEVLDVGGGDGALLDRVLARNPGTRATLVDLAPRVGMAIAAERRSRVRCLPATPLAACRERGAPAPDVVLVSDLLHHVPPSERESLLRDVRAVAGDRPLQLVVKDVAPGSLRARLGVLRGSLRERRSRRRTAHARGGVRTGAARLPGAAANRDAATRTRRAELLPRVRFAVRPRAVAALTRARSGSRASWDGGCAASSRR